MRYLLDTQVWLWMCAAPERLSRRARAAIEKQDSELLLSVASAWEIAIKHALGRLTLPVSPREYLPSRLAQTAVIPQGITLRHVLRTGELPQHHRDPFDRLIVAQALEDDLTLITADGQLAAYRPRLLRT